MPRAPKRTFKVLPAGATGSSTNPGTIARNERRRKLNPLQAEYERARANKGNRISSKIKRLRKTAAYINAFDDEERRCMEQGIRGVEEAVYRADRAEIARLFAEREGVGTASAGEVGVGSKQLGVELCIVVPEKDARNMAFAEGLGAVEAAEEEDEDVEIDKGGVDESASDGSFDGIPFYLEAASEIEEKVDTDDTIVDCAKVGIAEEGAEEISSMELRCRIRQRIAELLAMLDELAVVDKVERRLRREGKVCGISLGSRMRIWE